MKDIVTYINESKGQRLSLRKTNRPYDPEHDILIELKNTRDARSKELKVKHAEENHKIAFDNLINTIKAVQKYKSELTKYFDSVYFDDGGSKDMINIDLLTCDINKFSYKFLASNDHYAKDGYIDDIESEILYDNEPYKYCKIRSDKNNVSKTWLSSCALCLTYNDNFNDEMAEMAVKQFKGKNKYAAYDYRDFIRLNVCDEQSIKKLIKCIDDIVDRW